LVVLISASADLGRRHRRKLARDAAMALADERLLRGPVIRVVELVLGQSIR
jgi:hypothetical protein